MDLLKIYREEDLFPREFTAYAERKYGLLFYNENNKDSYDSNHAIIFKDRINDVTKILEDITEFYREGASSLRSISQLPTTDILRAFKRN